MSVIHYTDRVTIDIHEESAAMDFEYGIILVERPIRRRKTYFEVCMFFFVC